MNRSNEAYSEGGFARKSLIRGRCLCVSWPNYIVILSFNANSLAPFADLYPRGSLKTETKRLLIIKLFF